jgi:hypothetical protein
MGRKQKIEAVTFDVPAKTIREARRRMRMPRGVTVPGVMRDLLEQIASGKLTVTFGEPELVFTDLDNEQSEPEQQEPLAL